MTEILFYHLEGRPLEAVLPLLLEKTLERGWRAVVETGSRERAESLDTALWTWRDDSFLPHGLDGAGNEAAQPILITTEAGNRNAANVRFFVDRAVPGGDEAGAGRYERLVYLFDGHDPEAVEAARAAWSALRVEHELTYWQQDASGRWSRKA